MTRIAVVVVMVWVVAFIPGASVAQTGDHCVYRLVPQAQTGSVTSASLELIGCYAAYEEAIETGLGGTVDLASGITPWELTDAQLESTSSDVVIGTEWNLIGYSGSSNSYVASSTCTASTTWEVAYVTDAWNDLFSSGKGFGGCDKNRKFAASNFGGASLLCTPNCSNYGSLSNEVSSLRWRVN